MKTYQIIKLSEIKQIIELGKKSRPQLFKMQDDPAYTDKSYTKEQLIYQIVFKADAPIR